MVMMARMTMMRKMMIVEMIMTMMMVTGVNDGVDGLPV